MIRLYKIQEAQLKEIDVESFKDHLDEATWIDLYQPTEHEERLIENLLSINIPTRDEMHEIELSSRLYKRNNTVFTTFVMTTNVNTSTPESHAVTFVLHHKHLITIRYVDVAPFNACPTKLKSQKEDYRQGSSIFAWMLEEITDQLADILENIAHAIEKTSLEIFNSQNGVTVSQVNFKKILSAIGTYQNLLSKSQESLFGLTRVVSFIAGTSYFEGAYEHKSIQLTKQDLPPLIEHATFLSNKINFLLDATLGMINIEQNAIIKIFSVAAVVFLPPTLIASAYGMNFTSIPELHWSFGYPMALILMVLSAFLPYKFFKHKGWL